MGPGSRVSLQSTRHVAANRKRPSVQLCIAYEKASEGLLRCEDLRPDVDWVYLATRKCKARRDSKRRGDDALTTRV
jgi:DNA-binding transcriptional regulator YdaS (Cro superfamily)